MCASVPNAKHARYSAAARTAVNRRATVSLLPLAKSWTWAGSCGSLVYTLTPTLSLEGRGR